MISIHAPTRGATKSLITVFSLTFISIHAPTRGATQGVIDLHSGLYDFNPRSHERSDESGKYSCESCKYFNPRSHERSDNKYYNIVLVYYYFNPRSHERSDCGVIDNWRLNKISIHAPTRGATIIMFHFALICANFNPRSHERSDF